LLIINEIFHHDAKNISIEHHEYLISIYSREPLEIIKIRFYAAQRISP